MLRFNKRNCFKIIALISVITALLLATLIFPEVDTDRIKVGVQATPAAAPILIADELGIFKKFGVDIQVEEFSAGKLALQALVSGSVDLALSGELPVVVASTAGKELVVISNVTVAEVDEIGVVLRAPYRSIKEVIQSGGRFATSFWGGPHYYTCQMFRELGFGLGQINLINQRPEDMALTLANGDIDGFIVFEPYPTIAEALTDTNHPTDLPKINYSQNYLLTSARGGVVGRSAESQILAALNEAIELIEREPSVAKAIVAKRTNLSTALISDLWGKFKFTLQLPHNLSAVWNDQINALLRDRITTDSKIPELGGD